jgi:dTDP-4-dehydrorhamnose 3,5-epimerase
VSFEFSELDIEGVKLVTSTVYEDERGYLMETYSFPPFEEEDISDYMVHDYYSVSEKNVLRGLHIQVDPAAQAKLIRCLEGNIYDVVVDLREKSDSYGEYRSIILSEGDNRAVYIPEGFAHGYLSLKRSSVYTKTTHPHNPNFERGIHWNAPKIEVDWPIEGDPIVSEKDKNLPTLSEFEN